MAKRKCDSRVRVCVCVQLANTGLCLASALFKPKCHSTARANMESICPSWSALPGRVLLSATPTPVQLPVSSSASSILSTVSLLCLIISSNLFCRLLSLAQSLSLSLYSIYSPPACVSAYTVHAPLLLPSSSYPLLENNGGKAQTKGHNANLH